MENPIKNNRLVSDMTFATRLLSFASDISCSDACGEDEKESMVYYASMLLRFQVATATDVNEIDYLKRVGNYKKFMPEFIITEDGIKVGAESKATLYSCLKISNKGDQVLQFEFKDKSFLRNNRVYFMDKDKCHKYIENNTPKYSENQLKVILINRPI